MYLLWSASFTKLLRKSIRGWEKNIEILLNNVVRKVNEADVYLNKDDQFLQAEINSKNSFLPRWHI